MNSVSTTIQKGTTISWKDQDAGAIFLIELAKASREVQEILVKALVRPTSYFRTREIGTRRLLTALKVADVAGTTVYHETEDLSTSDRRRQVWKLLLGWIREDLPPGRPALKRDVTQLRLVLNRAREWLGNGTGFDSKVSDGDLRIIEDTARKAVPKGAPRRGRHLGEHQKRIMAGVELLRQWGVEDLCRMVVEPLWSWRLMCQSNTILNPWGRYKSYPWRHPDRPALPAYRLKIIFPLVIRQLKPFIESWAAKGKA